MTERNIANYPENLYAHTYKTSMEATSSEMSPPPPKEVKKEKDTEPVKEPAKTPEEIAKVVKEATEYVKQTLAQKLQKKPLHSWSENELTGAYYKLRNLQKKLGGHTPSEVKKNIVDIEEVLVRWGLTIAQQYNNEQRSGNRSLGAAAITPEIPVVHPKLVNILTEVNDEAARLGTQDFREPAALEGHIKRVQALIDADAFAGNPADLEQAHGLIKGLNTRIDDMHAKHAVVQRQREESRDSSYGFLALNMEDISALSDERDIEAPLRWLDDSFDAIYRVADKGAELNSPNVEAIQRAFGDAARFLQARLKNKEKKIEGDLAKYEEFIELEKIVKKFVEQQQIRLNLIVNRTMIAAGEIEKIQGSSGFLGAQGLLRGYGMENGVVEVMASRMGERFDDQRLMQTEHHATPEMAYKLQDDLIEEQLELAKKGIGFFAQSGDRDLTRLAELSPTEQLQRERKVKADITRAVRTAYDVFVNSQRMGVLVARGRHLSNKTDVYFSDPVSSVFSVYNLEDLSINKWSTLNLEQQEFLEEMKNDLVDSHLRELKKKGEQITLTKEEREILATQLFRDFVSVPDFFSSSWRMKGIVTSIDKRLMIYFQDKLGKEAGAVKAKERADNLALFIRLKQAQDDGSPKKIEAAWEKIAEYRPEEIVRLFRERAQDNHEAPHEFQHRLKKLFDHDAFKNYSRNGREQKHGIRNYDDFKEEFGSLINYLRQKGFKDYDQLNIGKMDFSDPDNDKYKDAIAKWCGEENISNIKEMYQLMTSFAKESTKDLMQHTLFNDLKVRTLLVDDLLLSELEEETVKKKVNGQIQIIKDERGNEIKVVPVSKTWASPSSGQSGDALKRAWNDTSSAIEAGKSLITFLTTEEKKERWKAGMDFSKAVAGYQSANGAATAIRFTLGTYLHLAKQNLGLDVMGLDKYPIFSRRPTSKMQEIYGPQAEALGRDALRHELDEIRMFLSQHAETDEDKEKAVAYYHELERLLEVSLGDTVKLRGLRVIFFLILTGFFEGYKIAEAGVSGGNSSGGGGHH